jgi:hypothetical protein
VRLNLIVVLCLLAGCATTPQSSARYWNLDGCVSARSPHVRFNRPNGDQLVIVPRQSCEALKSATQKIESASGYPLSRVLIADLQDPNAFASRDKEGKPIAVVTLGMLSSLGSDEDAWAGLMGHEVAHLVKRHAEGRDAARAGAQGAGNVVANVISYTVPGVGGLIGGTIAGTAAQMAVYGSYTRPQEAEADELGLQWMVAAGYDPRGLVRLFEILGRRASAPSFLSTHPAAADRAQAVDAFIATNPVQALSSIAANRRALAPSYQASATMPIGAVQAASCRDATSEIRLTTLCLTADGCNHQVEAIKKFCTNAATGSCSAAREQLTTYCYRGSLAFSDRACEVAARQVGVYCAD